MNKIFAMLPSDVRRALARKELERRGLNTQSDEEVRELLRRATDADLARMEEIGAPFSHLPASDWPEPVRAEYQAAFGQLLRHAHAATRDLPISTETPEEQDARCEMLAQRLENDQARKAA
jgi:hypothetical protein